MTTLRHQAAILGFTMTTDPHFGYVAIRPTVRLYLGTDALLALETLLRMGVARGLIVRGEG